MSTTTDTTVTNLGVAMFTVADQDAALRFYIEVLGWELRGDDRFGPPDAQMRWVEVAPPGSTARLALNAPMNGTPGGSSIGVETAELDAEQRRLEAAGVAVERMPSMPGAPQMLSLSDPDGNWVWVVQVP